MKKKRKGKNYWTLNKVLESTKGYETFKDWREQNRGAAESVYRNGWRDRLPWKQVEIKRKGRGHWDLDSIIESAKNYNTLKEWKKDNLGAYDRAKKKGWLKHLTWLEKRQKLPNGTLTKEYCIKEGTKYNSLKDFIKGSNSAYSKAQKNGWLHEIVKHYTIETGVRFVIYKWYFPLLNAVYIGSTNNLKRRLSDYERGEGSSKVMRELLKNGIKKELEILESSLCIDEANASEEEYIEYYRNNTDYRVLNIKKGGGLYYGNKKWDINKVLEKVKEVLSFGLSYSYIVNNEPSLYKAIRRLRLTNEVRSQFVFDNKTRGCWNVKEIVFNEAKKYSLISHVPPSILNGAKRNGWYAELKEEFELKVIKNRTKEACAKKAKLYSTKKDFREGIDSKYYQYAYRRGWLDEICNHMIVLCSSRTKEECYFTAKKYNSRKQFSDKDNTIYAYAQKKGWLDDICTHMIHKRKSRTIDECAKVALKYTSRSQFEKFDSTIYNYVLRKGWIDEVCKHMIYKSKSRTIKECLVIAKKYTTRKQFYNTDKTVYVYARNKGWLNEITKHMENNNT